MNTSFPGTCIPIIKIRWLLDHVIFVIIMGISILVRSHFYIEVVPSSYLGGGSLPLWESVGMRRGFAPHFRHLDDLFASQNVTLSTILFRSCWVSFWSPPFSACRRSFCPPNWPNLSFYSDLVESHFELRVAHPYCFWPRVHPHPTPTHPHPHPPGHQHQDNVT